MRQRSFANWPMTPMVKRILIINVVVWVVAAFFELWIDNPIFLRLFALIPQEVIPWIKTSGEDPLAPGQGIGIPRIWQIFTYMWIHSPGDVYHILFNSLFFWMIGGNLEQTWGSKTFLRFYLKCGVGAGLVVLIAGLLFSPQVPVVGASGALFGLIVAWGIHTPNRIIYFFGLFPLKVKHFCLIPIGMTLADFITRAQGVSHAAHLGGMAVGALLVTGFWRPEKAFRQLRYWWLRRKLKVIDGQRPKDKDPPGGGYWH